MPFSCLMRRLRRLRIRYVCAFRCLSGKVLSASLLIGAPPVLLSVVPVLARAVLLPGSISRFPMPPVLYLPLFCLYALLPCVSCAAVLCGCGGRPGYRLRLIAVCALTYWCCLLRLPLILCGAGPLLLFLCSCFTLASSVMALFPVCAASDAAAISQSLFCAASVLFLFCDLHLLISR